MNRRLMILLGLLLLAALTTPFVLRITHVIFLEPLAYYWWGMKHVIRVVPESYYWLFFIACFGLFALVFFVRDVFLHRGQIEKAAIKRGPVATLAEMIDRSGQSNYFKWVIANRLANIALRIWWGARVTGPDAIAPLADPEIQTYLENGLLSSFMDYRQKRKWFNRGRVTPFDVDIRNVIDYLESQMEQSRG